MGNTSADGPSSGESSSACPRAYTRMYVHTQTHAHTQLTASRIGRARAPPVHTHSKTHRRSLWEVESESSRPELWVVLLSWFPGSELHFEDGNAWGVAQPSRQLNRMASGEALLVWSQPRCIIQAFSSALCHSIMVAL